MLNRDSEIDIWSRFVKEPCLSTLIVDIIESRDLEGFHSIEKSWVSNPEYRVSLILFRKKNCDFFVFFAENVGF